MIVPMEQVLIAGPQGVLEPCLKLLHATGAIHIADSRDNRLFRGSGLKTGTSGKQIEGQTEKAESLLSSVRTSLALLEQAAPGRKDLLAFDPAGEDWLAPKYVDEVQSVSAEIAAAAARRRALESELEKIRIYRNLFGEFRPLVEQASALRSVEASGFVFREPGPGEEMESALCAATAGTHLWLRAGAREGYTPMLLLYPATYHEKVQADVFGKLGGRIQTLKVPAGYEKDTFAQTIAALFDRERAAYAELDGCCESLSGYAVRFTALLRTAERGLDYTVKKLRLQNFLAASGRAFWISGWVPEEKAPALKEALESRFGGAVVAFTAPPAPGEYGDVPVLLANPAWAAPFEKLLRFFPPPVYGSVDPTTFVAFFFPLFFGLIMGDAGYALVLFGIARFHRMRRADVPFWNDLTAILYACAFSTAAFGMLYGEFFGNLLGGHLPHVLDRKHDAVPLLAGVIALGGIHLALGKLIGAAAAFRRGFIRHGLDPVADIALLAVGAWDAWASYGGYPAHRPAAVAGVALVLVKVAAGGLKSLLETFRLLSNLLSYARLMALGMASLLLADVAERLFTLAGSGFWGVLIAVAVHLVNLTLGLLSPAIQSLRLHLVEFFGQFFRQGSVRYAPFGTA